MHCSGMRPGNSLLFGLLFLSCCLQLEPILFCQGFGIHSELPVVGALARLPNQPTTASSFQLLSLSPSWPLQVPSSSRRRRRRTRSKSRSLATTRQWALIPLPVAQAERLITNGAPTGAQYATYWGRTPRERYGRLLESSIVSFLGVFFSYFLSFIVGGFIATILGTLFVFWGILSPEFQAYQRNWELLGGRPLVEIEEDYETNRRRQGRSEEHQQNHAGLYASLFVGHVSDVCVVEDADDDVEYDIRDFADYTMVTDELEKFTGRPYLLRVRCQDQTGRALQVHTRMSEEYVGGVLGPGLPVTAILLSTDIRFTRLAALTDLYVPDANLWIGDYPYLDRDEMEKLLATDDDVWDALQAEAVEYPVDNNRNSDRSWDDDEDYDAEGYRTRGDVRADERVPVRRRKR